jgi:RHS repeat-associated protein
LGIVGHPDDFIETRAYSQAKLSEVTVPERSAVVGQLAYAVDFEGRVTAYLYDNRDTGGGRLVEKQYFADLDEYDEGEGTPDEYVTYHYDELGRNDVVAQHHGQDTDTTTYTYDEDMGYLTRVQNEQGAINYEYDEAGRLTRTYTGDSEPNPSSVRTDTSYTYDEQGRLSTVELNAHDGQSTNEVTEYKYHDNGQVHTITQANGVVFEYTFDSLGRLDLLKHYAPEEGGGNPNVYTDNRVIASFDYGYDPAGRCISALEQFDTNGSAGFELVQSFAWAYDDLDRLTAETFDLGDDGPTVFAGDYVTAYKFDLNGNRVAKETDHDYSGDAENMTADETIAYTYDDNGRLLTETKDAAGTDGDRHTVYQYGPATQANPQGERTEQTGKTVYQGLTAGTEQDKREVVANEYDLTGRLAGVTIARTGGGGGVTATTFEYDDGGNRVAQTAGTGEEAVTTTYLIDDNNLTGYSQTLEQTDRDDSDAVVKKTTYVVGADVIGQYVTEDSTTTGAIYLQDGHGSTRGLYATASAGLLDAALVTAGGSTWTKTLTYDAYGNALGFDPATAKTELLYNGESFNTRTGQQYLRARWYDSASGRFGSMDPWAGSAYSPLSFNGYNYCNSSPVMASDPSGMFALLPIAGAFTATTSLASAVANYGAAWKWSMAAASTNSIENKLAAYFMSSMHSICFAMDMFAFFLGVSAAGGGGSGGGLVGQLAIAGGGSASMSLGGAQAYIMAHGLRATLTLAFGLASFMSTPGGGGSGGGGSGASGSSGSSSSSSSGATKGVAKPTVTNPKLNNIVEDLYKGTKTPNQIGMGSTADAIRNELKTGLPTYGKFHLQKGQQYVNSLQNWLEANPNASVTNREAARQMLNDLQSALGGY